MQNQGEKQAADLVGFLISECGGGTNLSYLLVAGFSKQDIVSAILLNKINLLRHRPDLPGLDISPAARISLYEIQITEYALWDISLVVEHKVLCDQCSQTVAGGAHENIRNSFTPHIG